MDTNNIYEALKMVLGNEQHSAEDRARVAAGLVETPGQNEPSLTVLAIVLSNDKYSPEARVEAALGIVTNPTPTDGVPAGAPVNAQRRTRARNGMTRAQQTMAAIEELGGEAQTSELAEVMGMEDKQQKKRLHVSLSELTKKGDLVRIDRGRYRVKAPPVSVESENVPPSSGGPELSASA